MTSNSITAIVLCITSANLLALNGNYVKLDPCSLKQKCDPKLAICDVLPIILMMSDGDEFTIMIIIIIIIVKIKIIAITETFTEPKLV